LAQFEKHNIGPQLADKILGLTARVAL
jgi:hypothetical protein